MNRTYKVATGGRLVETGHARSSHLRVDEGTSRFALSDGSWIEPKMFNPVDPEGVLTASFGHPSGEFDIDDYLYILGVHFVRDGALYRGTLEIGAPSGHYAARLSQEKVLLYGLETA